MPSPYGRMPFHAYGNKSNQSILMLHGMICARRKFRKLLKSPDASCYILYPAMTGCCDNSVDLVSFADERAQIEAYVQDHPDGIPDAG